MNYRKSLLIGASALAINAALTGAVLLVPDRAFAACTTVGSGATISDASAPCVTWTGGAITITGSGVLSGSNTAVSDSGHIVGALTNSGSIHGSLYGINDNGGSITTITNNGGGSISGTSFAILNQAGSTISTIVNNGTIANSNYGVMNTGSIATIVNNSVINPVGGNAIGICVCNGSNEGVITNNGTIIGAGRPIVIVTGATLGTLNNVGTISSTGSFGMYIHNAGIGTITNSGAILGHQEGIRDDKNAPVNVLTNSGAISGGTTGITNTNGSSIGSLTNSGTISGSAFGINNVNTATINSISNSGLISGATAITSGSGNPIVNPISNTGTISGNINVGQALTITGGTGTLTGGSINTGSHNLVFNSTANQVLKDNVNVGAGNTFSVAGTLQVNAAESITGNYTQSSTAPLLINVTDSAHYGDLIVSGNGTMTNDQVSILGGLGAETLTIAQIAGTAAYTGITASISTAYKHLTIATSSINSGGFNDLLVTLSSGCQVVNSNTTVSSSTPCVLWDSSNVSIASNGIVTGSNTGIINNGNTVGTLTNSGSINGTNNGVYNVGSIAAIINNSTISGASIGIDNAAGGSIGTIANSGTISSAATAINNATGASIGTISNSGSISGHFGISNSGTTSSIANTGAISGTAAGLLNTNTIGAVNNSHTITGGSFGINNQGTIGSVVNSGYIAGATYGVYNVSLRSGTSSIGLINNSGTIKGNHFALQNYGIYGTIVNSGLLVGSSAGVVNHFNIGTLTNSGTITTAGSGTAGIRNSTLISLLAITPGGTVSGNSYGIQNTTNVNNPNSGTISTITNSGLITGGLDAILNNAGSSIGTISNAGLISGPTAIFSGGGGTILSAISNSGTIAGNINVNQALTFTGGSSGTPGTLTGGTITTNAHDLTFDSNANQLLADDINVGSSNKVINSGSLRVNAPHSITGNYTQGASGLLAIGITNTTAYGKLIASGLATMTNGQVLILPSINFSTFDGAYTIVQASSTGTDYSGVNATANGFAVSTSSIISGGVDELVVTLSGGIGTYGSIGNAAGGDVAPAVGAALDKIAANIANGGDASLAPILVTLNNLGQQSQKAEQGAIRQLGPSQVSTQTASTNTLMNQGVNVVAQHTSVLLADDGQPHKGMAAGSEYRTGIFWGQISGGVADQNSTATLGGYHQSSYGMTVGADDHITKEATLGLAFGWMHSNSFGRGFLSGTNVDANSFQLTGYGTQRFGSAFVDGMLGLGYNRFDQNRAIGFLGTTATANYSGMQYMARVDTGWDFALPDKAILTPMAGLQAVRSSNNGYTETGAGAADLNIGNQIVNSYATTLGAKATTTLPTSWGDLKPEVKLGWVHDLNNSPIPTNGTLGGVNFTTTTPRAAQDGLQTTIALTLQKTDTVAIRAEYDGDLRSGFSSNTGQVKVEWNF